MKRVLSFLLACNNPTFSRSMVKHAVYRSACQWVLNRRFAVFSAITLGLVFYLTLSNVLAAEENTVEPTQNEQAGTHATNKDQQIALDPKNNHVSEQSTPISNASTSEHASETTTQQAVEQTSDSAANTNTTQRQVAVVNIAVLMENSPRSQAIADKIKSEYFPQEQLLNKEREALRLFEEQLDAESTGLSAEERLKRSRDFRSRKRKYTRDYEDFRDRLSNARQRALALVRQDVLEAVDHVRTQAGIDIVLEDYVLASEEVDLTPKVLQYLQTRYQQTTEPNTPEPPIASESMSVPTESELSEDSETQPTQPIDQDEQPAQSKENKNRAISGEESSP